MAFCAVYDGHGGAEASDFARRELHRLLLHHVGSAEPTLATLCGALHAAFLSTDEHFLQGTKYMSGTTAVAALLTGSHLLVANAGDSRAALRRDGRAHALSVDHKPERRDEHGRIVAAGGFVANNRIMHSLAVSRALGDREYKLTDASDEQGLPFTASLVVADPEVRVCRAGAGDEVILACDGLWDVGTRHPNLPPRPDTPVTGRRLVERACRPHSLVCRLQVFSARDAFAYLDRCDAARSPQQAVRRPLAADPHHRSRTLPQPPSFSPSPRHPAVASRSRPTLPVPRFADPAAVSRGRGGVPLHRQHHRDLYAPLTPARGRDVCTCDGCAGCFGRGRLSRGDRVLLQLVSVGRGSASWDCCVWTFSTSAWGMRPRAAKLVLAGSCGERAAVRIIRSVRPEISCSEKYFRFHQNEKLKK